MIGMYQSKARHMNSERGGLVPFCLRKLSSSRSNHNLTDTWKTTTCLNCRKKAGIDSSEKEVIADNNL
jgi:hypothetical protein